MWEMSARPISTATLLTSVSRSRSPIPLPNYSAGVRPALKTPTAGLIVVRSIVTSVITTALSAPRVTTLALLTRNALPLISLISVSGGTASHCQPALLDSKRSVSLSYYNSELQACIS